MAGYKRPYPDAWGPSYPPDGPSSYYGGSYYSGMQWGHGYPGPSRYPPPPGNYYPSPAPVTGEYYSSPAPPQRDPPPPGDWDYAPPVKKEYDPSTPGPKPGQNNQPKERMDFTDDYSAFYGNASSYNNKGSRGGSYRGQGRGWGFGSRGGSNQYDNYGSKNRGGYQGQGRGGDGGGGGYRGRGSARGSDSRGGRGGKRGLPPNQFANKGKGRGHSSSAGSVPPVHSLAKEKATFLDVAQMSIPEKLHRFCLYLKDAKHDRGNAIQTINNALSASKLSMNPQFDFVELAWVSHTKLFTGTFTLDGVFIARSVGLSKKEMKLTTFEKALDVFRTHTVAEIYNLKDPGPEHIKDQILADRKIKAAASGKEFDIAKELEMPPLEKLVHNIKTRPESDSIIHTVEQACTRQCFTCTYKFEVEPTNRLFYTGKFTFNGIVLGRAHASNKKLCKRNTYTNVYDRLTTLSIEELQKDVPELNIKAEIDKDGRFIADKTILKEPLENRIEQFLSMIKQTTLVTGVSHTVDTAAMTCGLYPILVYKSFKNDDGTHLFKCELYIERMFIAEGEGEKKKDSAPDAYMNAYNLLKTTTVDTLMNKHRKMTDDEFHNPKTGDMHFKGTGKVLESNIEMLQLAGFDLDNLTDKMDDMVMIENFPWTKDRLKNSFCILKYTCANNGLFLQWEAEAIMSHNVFKCTVYISGKEVGYSFGFGRNHAKVLACSDVLYKLYANHDIIVSHNFHVVEDCIKYETLKEEAKKLKENGVKPVEPVFNEDADQDLPDQYFSTFIQMKLDEYVTNHNGEEYSQLVFGHGFTAPEWQDLKNRTRKLGLKHYCQRHEEEDCFIIVKKMSFQNLAKFLKQKEGHRAGKYELIFGDDKPKYADIETYLMKEFPDNADHQNSRDIRLALHARKKDFKRTLRNKALNPSGEKEKEDEDVDRKLAIMAREDLEGNTTGLGFNNYKLQIPK